MWAIKFLSGPKAGQEVVLQDGLLVIGREDSCQIQIPSKGISKKHAQVIVKGDSITIEDLNSSNGLFFNGKKIKSQSLKQGDRISLHKVFIEIVKKESSVVHPYFQPYTHPHQSPSFQNNYEQAEMNQNTEDQKKSLDITNLQKGFKGYIHNALLPGVYKLAEWVDFKWLVGGFVLGFVCLVMTFSSVPLIQILKSSVEQESKNHAESISVTLSKLNREHLQSGLHTALNVSYAQRRPGVQKAYIINAVDGRILAPAELAHTYPKDSFVHKARKINQTTVKKIGKSSIGAVTPITFYNPTTGENLPVAYSVVYYDLGTLAIGNAKVLSLLIQNLFIALILGFIVFFFLINLIEFPLRSINKQFNSALINNKSSSISITYQSELLNELCNHINTSLNKISLNQLLNTKNNDLEDSGIEVNRVQEMNNLVEIIGFPCLSINLEDETIASMNSNFSEQIGFDHILHNPLSNIDDSSLKEHLDTLLEQGKSNPGEISFGELNLKGMSIQTTCQFIMGKSNPAYAVVTFTSAEEEGAA